MDGIGRQFYLLYKVDKSVVSLRYSCICAIGCRRYSTNAEVRSVGPLHPAIIGLPTAVGLFVGLA